jgi:hypothetical protein
MATKHVRIAQRRTVLLVALPILLIIIFGSAAGVKRYRDVQRMQQKNVLSGCQEGVHQVQTEIDYDVFNTCETSLGVSWNPKIWYQDFGTVENGPHAGWKRILGIREVDGPDGQMEHVFITKDGVAYLADSWEYGGIYNSARVRGTTSIPLPFPHSIPLGSFVLVRREFLQPADSVAVVGKGKDIRIADVPGISFVPSEHPAYSERTEAVSYMESGTDLLARNQDGVTVGYETVSLSSFQKERDPAAYGSSMLIQTRSEILPKDGIQLYNHYSDYFQFGCGQSGLTLDQRYVASLEEIGTLKGGELVYRLPNKDNPLAALSYAMKIGKAFDDYKKNGESFLYNPSTDTTIDVVPPSYAEYLERNPIIIVKDSLGRYVVLEEYEYSTIDGCGKPVIYLYPEKDTAVSISFKKAMNFSLSIPPYGGEWNVMAHPDGSLTNLTNEFDNCASIDTSRVGSEYAYDACHTNTYPYLFWEGKTVGEYPLQTAGWIVGKDDLRHVMDEKLTQLSLDKKERKEMLDFWVAELLKKHAPYYRISFIQKQELNRFIPMRVSPAPDTILRVFLDWEPLDKQVSIPPQELYGTKRIGFTLVEWGGLKRQD